MDAAELMEAEVAAQIGAELGERTPERVAHRNGYRPRTWDTRVGELELQIPTLGAPRRAALQVRAGCRVGVRGLIGGFIASLLREAPWRRTNRNRSHFNQFIKRGRYFHANPCRSVSHMKSRLSRTNTSIGRREKTLRIWEEITKPVSLLGTIVV